MAMIVTPLKSTCPSLRSSVRKSVRFACPKTSLRATLPDAHFVLKPDTDLLEMNLRRQNGLHFAVEVFF
jgi:hypothetical protein